MRLLRLALIPVLLFWPALLCADPVAVSYSVSGSPGAWSLDFTVTNQEIGTDQDIYLFGVLLSGPGVTGSPSAFDPMVYPTWTNSGLGGSDLLYNNVWLDSSASSLTPGQTLSGFDVLVTDSTTPQSVPWFAISTGDIPYAGGENFGDPYNPGFEGTTTPEPATVWMLGTALGLLGLKGIGRNRS
jgi:hypothetical protein